MTPEEIFGKAWDILVEHAGASTDPMNRETFIMAYLAPTYPAIEWRFGGYLGFGGKFWRNNNGYYISCYREDETPKRRKIVEKVNELLKELPYFEPRSP